MTCDGVEVLEGVDGRLHVRTATCPFLLGDPPRSCKLCAKPLSGRMRVWCSQACESDFYRNHLWSSAREAARARVAVFDDPDGFGWRCERCSLLTLKPEVNHKTPILGRHGQSGCHHHQDGLEVLCHRCHLDVTAAQRARGWVALDGVVDGALVIAPQPSLFDCHT